jgi:hypothetical protein
MAVQTTPRTQTQQNISAAQADLDPNQSIQDVGQGDDAAIYENRDGAQTGGTRAFNANATNDSLPNVLQEDAALTGRTNTRTPESPDQGITNHSASEESQRQKKVVSERPDAQSGVDQVGHRVR